MTRLSRIGYGRPSKAIFLNLAVPPSEIQSFGGLAAFVVQLRRRFCPGLVAWSRLRSVSRCV